MRSPRLLHAGIALTLAATLGLAGCSTGEPQTEQAPTEPITTASNAESEPTEPETTETDSAASETQDEASPTTANETASIEPDIDVAWITGKSEIWDEAGTSLLASDFRVGLHDGYYRVVVEFVGEGEPGWTIEWVEESTEIARGEPLPIPQGNVLDVMIHGAGWPVVKGAPEYFYNGPADKRIDENVIAWFDGAFEADTHVAISADKVRAYRVFTLESPKRLVIDLKR
ncbi:MAG: hypothetical protein Q4D87_07450 [Actinomycetaceae bacterium]|nr:hypothetical protein [Actinomycetaceae bacterium]